jgi:hypothetical protein
MSVSSPAEDPESSDIRRRGRSMLKLLSKPCAEFMPPVMELRRTIMRMESELPESSSRRSMYGRMLFIPNDWRFIQSFVFWVSESPFHLPRGELPMVCIIIINIKLGLVAFELSSLMRRSGSIDWNWLSVFVVQSFWSIDEKRKKDVMSRSSESSESISSGKIA